MNEEMRSVIHDTAASMRENCLSSGLFPIGGMALPDREEIIDILCGLRATMFPGYFADECAGGELSEYALGHKLTCLYARLIPQLTHAYALSGFEGDANVRAQCVCARFFAALPQVQKMLLMDVQAAFNGDPAAKSAREVVFSYPGLFAICVYRIAHELYADGVPFIPRIMTEHAHSLTGIDINAGARIGKYFFIDHGTGVVIGETTEIGDNVKLYQGVTLGALSTRQGQSLSGVKRHPTIGNAVTIYSGASILGGETVIGDHCVIGGNAFITSSVPPSTRVSVVSPELNFREVKRKTVWENTDS